MMGCDIHAHIEYAEYERDGKPIWWHYCTFFFLRDYWLFALMAGVRAYSNETAIVPPRGVPDDAAHETEAAYSLLVVDEYDKERGTTSREQALKYVQCGASVWLTDPDQKWARVTHPDWHTPSWLTLNELQQVLHSYVDMHPEPPRANFYAALAAMKAFEDRGLKTRLVFWFDN